jgi:toxin ParE1/3/4
MTRRIFLLEDATLDLNEHYSYLLQSDQDIAISFFDAARQTFANLARMPGVGRVYESGEDDISDVHKWFVKGFKKYLIFYRYDDETLEILRIVYATRDLAPILKDL